MLVELVVEDPAGRPIVNLKAPEILVEQDGVPQTISSLVYDPERSCYELRYAPTSGHVGAVSIRVLRKGSRLRGPEGPGVKPRWVPPEAAFEAPLRAALDAREAPDDFPFELGVLRFEAREDTLHHSFVAEVPMPEIAIARIGDRSQAHLSFALRVRTEKGLAVHFGSLDQPIDFDGTAPKAIRVRRFVWNSHVHLREGRYLAEVAVMDRKGSRISVRKTALVVEPWSRGLRISSLAFLLSAGDLMQGEDVDNPFQVEDVALVPTLRPASVAGSEGTLHMLAWFYLDPTTSDSPSAVMELHREGQLRARAALPLPAPGPEGQIRYVGALRFRSLQPGSYDLKLIAQQGRARVEEAATFVVTPPLRVE